ncbi:hypothetical protein Q9299_20850 [Gemmobacter fulvus]|uniref:hypothetical protein n=1 Tax=Gemmobacter fulvus TaxID=2840474 RepID=UPI002796C298|nr:hypothetical protein [Gemmobacter fulvus]MDQ1850757.1 hypothetical protein [Gemmobacter fulvus]
MNELSEIFDRRYHARLCEVFTDEVFAAYKKSPLGPHDDNTARVVRAFGNASVAGKEVVISLGADGPWGIGRIEVGAPGNIVHLPDTFSSYEDALRAVFSMRRDAFFAISDTSDVAGKKEKGTEA